MAWEWSMTAEAEGIAYEKLARKSKHELLVILREWRYHEMAEAGHDNPVFRLEYNGRKVPKDALVDAVWDKMSEARTADNGGGSVWACPEGCHVVHLD